MAKNAATGIGAVSSEVKSKPETEKTNLMRDVKSEAERIERGDVSPSLQKDISDAVTKIDTVNMMLEGKRHPVSDVPYVRREIDVFGKIISGVFPDFSKYCSASFSLPKELYSESDYKQFRYCEQQLKESYETGRIDTSQFSERQLEQIRDGVTPEGYTWHHHEVPGRMELVKSDVHEATPHTGGRSIWGGGSECR